MSVSQYAQRNSSLHRIEYIHLLDLLISHFETELLHTRLNRVPSSQARDERDVTRHAEVRGVEDLVGAGVVEDRLGCCGC